MKSFPVLSLLGCLLAGSIQLLSAASYFELQTNQSEGLWYRWILSHFCHYNLSHFFWDVSAFLVLGSLVEQIKVRWLWLLFALMSLVSLYVMICRPDLNSYRGLSGIVCGLLGMVCVCQFLSRDLLNILLATTMSIAFLAKSIFEIISGQSIFADSSNFVNMPDVHLLGFFIGVLIVVMDRALSFKKPQVQLL